MEESILYAKKYLEDILSFFGLNTDVSASHDEDVIELSVSSTHLNGFLIGQHGNTLRSLQFLISTALKNTDHEYTRVNVDIADYKKQRAERLAGDVEGWIKQVRNSKEDKILRPMSPVDRRTVHQVVGEVSDVETESVGEGRERHIVLNYVELDDEPEEVVSDEKPEEAEQVSESDSDQE